MTVYTLEELSAKVDAISETLNAKADRDLNNRTTSFFVITEVQRPTASNNYTWYRKWSDGWIEQGGTFGTAYAAYTEKTFTFPKPFSDTNYVAICNSAHTGDLYYPAVKFKTVSAVTFVLTYNSTGCGSWYACGY